MIYSIKYILETYLETCYTGMSSAKEENNMSMLLATRLKNKRKELKLSQKELAEGICEQGQISYFI